VPRIAKRKKRQRDAKVRAKRVELLITKRRRHVGNAEKRRGRGKSERSLAKTSRLKRRLLKVGLAIRKKGGFRGVIPR